MNRNAVKRAEATKTATVRRALGGLTLGALARPGPRTLCILSGRLSGGGWCAGPATPAAVQRGHARAGKWVARGSAVSGLGALALMAAAAVLPGFSQSGFSQSVATAISGGFFGPGHDAGHDAGEGPGQGPGERLGPGLAQQTRGPERGTAGKVAARPALVGATAGDGGAWTWRDHVFDPDRAIGFYSGLAHTQPATITVTGNNDGAVTISDFDWIGKPFDNPIYYGVRIRRWNPLGMFGSMIDVNHAKAIADKESVATLTGAHNGEPLPAKAKIRDAFSHLEFSNGHNMVTYNGLLKLGWLFGRVRPYVGAGAGVSLPHTEFGFRGDEARTYKYQFGGFVGQGVAGIEVDLGRTVLLFEYKFTYAPMDVPLSHAWKAPVMITDLWTQFDRWWRGIEPPGGRLQVDLLSHHGIAGVMVKTGRAGVYNRPASE